MEVMSKIHAFIVDDIGTPGAICTISDSDVVHQWLKVLRFEVGERIRLYDGKGNEADVEIVSFSKHEAEVRVGDIRENAAAARAVERDVALYLAVIKGDRFEWAVQKCVELGVSEIVPVVTNRTIKKEVNMSRLVAIAKEACEQSMRSGVVRIHEPITFEDALQHAKTAGRTLILGDYVGVRAPHDLASVCRPALFIGPEGGFTDAELALAEDCGVEKVCLGASVLRAETAAVAMTVLAVI